MNILIIVQIAALKSFLSSLQNPERDRSGGEAGIPGLLAPSVNASKFLLFIYFSLFLVLLDVEECKLV